MLFFVECGFHAAITVVWRSTGTVHLDDVADLGHVDKLVDETLSVHFGKNAALVVVPAIVRNSQYLSLPIFMICMNYI